MVDDNEGWRQMLMALLLLLQVLLLDYLAIVT